MNPTGVRRAIYGKLSGDTTLNGLLASPPSGWSKSIFHRHAPDNAGYPFVVFLKLAGTPTYTHATKAALETDVWLVKAIDQQSTADRAEAVSARLNALLGDASLSIAGSDTVLYLRRESDVDFEEIEGGENFIHVGSQYRLVVEPA